MKKIKNNHSINLVVFDIAFWGLLAALWIAGAYRLYYSLIEEAAIVTKIPEPALWFATVVIISSMFVIFRKKIQIFKGSNKMVTNSKHRRKKK